MSVEVGQSFYRRNSRGFIRVRKVTKIDGDKAEYETIFGYALHQKGKCNLRCLAAAFCKGNDGGWKLVPDDLTLEELDHQITKSYLVLGTNGQPLLRSNQNKAKWYLRKGYAKLVGDCTIQLLSDQTEENLKRKYGTLNHPFFMADKSGCCVVCGKKERLIGHHVIHTKIKVLLPKSIRSELLNVLWMCRQCERKCHSFPDPVFNVSDPVATAKIWRDHFLYNMKPQFLPEGWDIFNQTFGLQAAP